MKRFNLLFCAVIFLTVSSCKIMAPTFKGIENVKTETVNKQGLKFSADVVIYNPNFFRLKVWDIAANVFLDDKLLATIGDTSVMLIKSKSDFRVPLGASLNPQSGIFDQLKNLLNIFVKKEAKLKVEGTVHVKFFCRTHKIPFMHEQKVDATSFKK